eukprot:tig00000681_g3139.t1
MELLPAELLRAIAAPAGAPPLSSADVARFARTCRAARAALEGCVLAAVRREVSLLLLQVPRPAPVRALGAAHANLMWGVHVEARAPRIWHLAHVVLPLAADGLPAGGPALDVGGVVRGAGAQAAGPRDDGRPRPMGILCTAPAAGRGGAEAPVVIVVRGNSTDCLCA